LTPAIETGKKTPLFAIEGIFFPKRQNIIEESIAVLGSEGSEILAHGDLGWGKKLEADVSCFLLI
jgi:hypothetical protein